MDSNAFEKRYKDMSTDELLNIYVSCDLVEDALNAMLAELKRRGVTNNEIVQAKRDAEYVMTIQNRPTKRPTIIIVNILGVLSVTAILIIVRFIKGVFSN